MDRVTFNGYSSSSSYVYRATDSSLKYHLRFTPAVMSTATQLKVVRRGQMDPLEGKVSDVN